MRGKRTCYNRGAVAAVTSCVGGLFTCSGAGCYSTLRLTAFFMPVGDSLPVIAIVSFSSTIVKVPTLASAASAARDRTFQITEHDLSICSQWKMGRQFTQYMLFGVCVYNIRNI